MDPDAHPRDDATELRDALVDDLIERRVVTSAMVETAIRAVPREFFVPEVALRDAYADRPQRVKEVGGLTLSTISQPTMIAIMLEAAELEPGHRVLEIGTGSGYNAALLAEIVGPAGRVVTIDVEHDLVVAARDRLSRRGLDQVVTITADGREGFPSGGPYHRLISTVGVTQVFPSWVDQIVDGGLVLAPLLGEDRLVVARRQGGELREVSSSPARFIPLR